MYAQSLANTAAASVAARAPPHVVPQTPAQTSTLVQAAGWLENAPVYSMDTVPGTGTVCPPGTANNWMSWNGQGFTGPSGGVGYPPMPTPFGPDSRLLAPGGAVYPRGDYAGTLTDPITGVKYAAFTRAMPDWPKGFVRRWPPGAFKPAPKAQGK